MLKNKLFFLNFFIFAFYVESFPMRENDQNDNFNNNSSNNHQNSNRPRNAAGPGMDGDVADNNMFIDGGQRGKKTYQEVFKKKINKPAHIFFYLVLSPFLNVNNLDWRYYFSQGKLNKGGVFFYYGFLNFGIGFNRKTFCDTCSCRIIGVNLFQFLGSFVLYFFVDKCESIKKRWNEAGTFPFFLFNDLYFDEYIKSIDPESIVKDTVHVDYFKQVILYSFSIFPFLSFFTFDFQLFEYLTFSLNIGSFLFLAVAFFIYTFYTHSRKTFGIISKAISSNHNTFGDHKGTDKKDDEGNIQL